MNLVCMIYVVCISIATPGSSERSLECSILSSECASVSPLQEALISRACDASENCVEKRKGLFVVRQSVPAVVETRI